MVQLLLGTKSSVTFPYFLALSVEDTLLLLPLCPHSALPCLGLSSTKSQDNLTNAKLLLRDRGEGSGVKMCAMGLHHIRM